MYWVLLSCLLWLLFPNACFSEAWLYCTRNQFGRTLCHRHGPFVTGDVLTMVTFRRENPGACYARLSGPVILAGEVIPELNLRSHASKEHRFLLRFRVPLEVPGDYMFWMACYDKAWIRFTPMQLRQPNPIFLGSYSIFSELPQFRVSGPNLYPSSCVPCRSGSEEGLWVHSRVAPPCAGDGTGQWFDNDHVWLPRGCVHRFVDRESFTQGPAVEVVLIGDSMLRGMFCDFQNWLLRRVYPPQLVGALKYF
eukprot:RCo038843